MLMLSHKLSSISCLVTVSFCIIEAFKIYIHEDVGDSFALPVEKLSYIILGIIDKHNVTNSTQMYFEVYKFPKYFCITLITRS